MACNVNSLIETEGLFKVTGSHVHCKGGSISETMFLGLLIVSDI